MSDLISRQAVLESLETDYSLILFDSYGNLTFAGERIIEAIKRVPSVEPEKCGDCISRQAAVGLKTIAPIAPVMDGEAVHYEEVIFVRDLEKLQSVVPERKHGHWIMQNDRSKKLLGWSFCSECNAWIGEPTDYCSNCGADMREVDG